MFQWTTGNKVSRLEQQIQKRMNKNREKYGVPMLELQRLQKLPTTTERAKEFNIARKNSKYKIFGTDVTPDTVDSTISQLIHKIHVNHLRGKEKLEELNRKRNDLQRSVASYALESGPFPPIGSEQNTRSQNFGSQTLPRTPGTITNSSTSLDAFKNIRPSSTATLPRKMPSYQAGNEEFELPAIKPTRQDMGYLW